MFGFESSECPVPRVSSPGIFQAPTLFTARRFSPPQSLHSWQAYVQLRIKRACFLLCMLCRCSQSGLERSANRQLPGHSAAMRCTHVGVHLCMCGNAGTNACMVGTGQHIHTCACMHVRIYLCMYVYTSPCTLCVCTRTCVEYRFSSMHDTPCPSPQQLPKAKPSQRQHCNRVCAIKEILCEP